MRILEKRCPSIHRVWLPIVASLAFCAQFDSASASTLWVQPAEALSEYGPGHWAATDDGSATFTFALPDDIERFVGAKVVLLSSANRQVTYRSQLALSQSGLGPDFYSDDVLVTDPIELLANHVTEVDLAGLIPHQDLLLPGQDYLTLRFSAQGAESGEVSPDVKILGLRLEYALAAEPYDAQTEQASGVSADAVSTTAGTALTSRTRSVVATTNSAAGAGDVAPQGQVLSVKSATQSVTPVLAGEAGDSPDTTGYALSIAGLASFTGLNGGQITISTPGGWPGIVAYSQNGYRRDITFHNNGIKLAPSDSSSPPSHGLWIANDGNVGIGTDFPSEKLSVNGRLGVNGGMTVDGLNGGQINVSTPGGWPGLVAYSQNGYRRDITFHNGGLNLASSDSSSAPAWERGITISNNGNVGIGTISPGSKLTVAGWTETQVLKITGGSDISEGFTVTAPGAGTEPIAGMIVSIDPASPGALKVSEEPYDRKVAGVISGAGGVEVGLLMGQQGTLADGRNPVALTGRVYCHADATEGAILPGDLLTTSATPGHAMKVTDHEKAKGAIVGKAMTSLEEGKGLVLVLVSLQ